MGKHIASLKPKASAPSPLVVIMHVDTRLPDVLRYTVSVRGKIVWAQTLPHTARYPKRAAMAREQERQAHLIATAAPKRAQSFAP